MTITNQVIKTLHDVQTLRQVAKRLFRGVSVRQPFYDGVIYCDAVEHSWAWANGPLYESFDRELQDRLLELSRRHDLFIDLGCNVGAMTLSVLLRNPNARAICIDPNPRATELLEKSLQRNGLASRAQVVRAAVAATGQSCRFDFLGSVTGHVSSTGVAVESMEFAPFLSAQLSGQSVLLKIDVEGSERELLQCLGSIQEKSRLTLMVELHPCGWNRVGAPKSCIGDLLQSGALVRDLKGAPMKDIDETEFTQIVATW